MGFRAGGLEDGPEIVPDVSGAAAVGSQEGVHWATLEADDPDLAASSGGFRPWV